MGIVDLKSGSTLTIRDLVPEDSGFYKCKGENFMGSDESEISLVVEEAEPEGDGYLLIIGKFKDFFTKFKKPLGGTLVGLVIIAIFIVAGAYAKKLRSENQRRRERERNVASTVPADGLRI